MAYQTPDEFFRSMTVSEADYERIMEAAEAVRFLADDLAELEASQDVDWEAESRSITRITGETDLTDREAAELLDYLNEHRFEACFRRVNREADEAYDALEELLEGAVPEREFGPDPWQHWGAATFATDQGWDELMEQANFFDVMERYAIDVVRAVEEDMSMGFYCFRAVPAVLDAWALGEATTDTLAEPA